MEMSGPCIVVTSKSSGWRRRCSSAATASNSCSIWRRRRSACTWRCVFTSNAKKCLRISFPLPQIKVILTHFNSCLTHFPFMVSHLKVIWSDFKSFFFPFSTRRLGRSLPHAGARATQPATHVCVVTGREHALLDDTAQEQRIRLSKKETSCL